MVSTVAEFGDDTKELHTLRHTHTQHTYLQSNMNPDAVVKGFYHVCKITNQSALN